MSYVAVGKAPARFDAFRIAVSRIADDAVRKLHVTLVFSCPIFQESLGVFTVSRNFPVAWGLKIVDMRAEATVNAIHKAMTAKP